MEFNPDQKQKLLNSVLKKHIEHFDFNPDSFGMSKAHLFLSSSNNTWTSMKDQFRTQ